MSNEIRGCLGNKAARLPPNDLAERLRDNARYERGLEAAFQDAVRLHRVYNLPVDVRKGGKIAFVSPFDIHLPEDDDPSMPRRVTNGKD